MSRRYFWPIMLILAGTLFLLSNLNILPGEAWDYIWPAFLILLGLSWLLPRRGGSLEPASDSLALDGAKSARITFKHGAGRLRVGAGADPALLFSGEFGGGLEKRVQRTGDSLEVTLTSESRDVGDWLWPGNWGESRRGLVWDMLLNPDIPLALAYETGASESQLDLSALKVTELTIKTGASATTVTLPAQAGHTRARIESGAASVDVTIPSGVAARIRGTMGLGALDVDGARFPKREGVYQSPDFESAANRVELEIQGGVGAVKVR